MKGSDLKKQSTKSFWKMSIPSYIMPGKSTSITGSRRLSSLILRVCVVSSTLALPARKRLIFTSFHPFPPLKATIRALLFQRLSLMTLAQSSARDMVNQSMFRSESAQLLQPNAVSRPAFTVSARLEGQQQRRECGTSKNGCHLWWRPRRRSNKSRIRLDRFRCNGFQWTPQRK